MTMDERKLVVEEFLQPTPDEVSLIDIREENQVQFGTIPGAENIPSTKLQELYRLPRDKKVYVFCQKGELSEEIVEILVDAGYDAYHLKGGYLAYLSSL